MKFIKLTDVDDDQPMFINMDKVDMMHPAVVGEGTALHIGGRGLTVKETVRKIGELLAVKDPAPIDAM